MVELIGKYNLWDFHSLGHWLVITTNGSINSAGKAVMGRGIAEQAAEKYPDLPSQLADKIRRHGLCVTAFPSLKIVAFPVKNKWADVASIPLIARSAGQLATFADRTTPDLKKKFYLPRPGCGNGRRSWSQVRPVVEGVLDDRFIVVFNPEWKRR